MRGLVLRVGILQNGQASLVHNYTSEILTGIYMGEPQFCIQIIKQKSKHPLNLEDIQPQGA